MEHHIDLESSHIDFLDCERLLLPCVTLHLRFYRSPNTCAIESVGTWAAADIKRVDQIPYALVNERASLFVNNVVLSCCQGQHRKSFDKKPSCLPIYLKSHKSFIIQAGQNCLIKENTFGTEPVRRLIFVWSETNN